jgi:hypothetical protein
MKTSSAILITLAFASCQTKESVQTPDREYFEITESSPLDTLFRVSNNEYETGEVFGYINQKGDTVIPSGRFIHSFSDTIVNYGIVIEKVGDRHDLIGINQKGQRLYEVFWFDNGPDMVSEGMFRILQNEKIGYADTTGKIIIKPQFACATPFSNGQAQVAFDCEQLTDTDEHTRMESDNWFYIDKKGNRITN